MDRDQNARLVRGNSQDPDTNIIAQKNQKKKQNLYRHIIYRDAIFFPVQGDRLIESPIFSNLTLQKLMYFNIYYDFLFFYLMIVTYLYKLYTFEIDAFQIIRPVLLIPMAIVEVLRFRNGYTGNLNETFPDLFAFNLLTIGSMGLIIAFLIFPARFPLEIACYILFLIFGFLQVIAGYYTMIKLSASQEALFYLRSANSRYRIKKDVPETKEKEIELTRVGRSGSEGEEGIIRRRNPGSYEPLAQDDEGERSGYKYK